MKVTATSTNSDERSVFAGYIAELDQYYAAALDYEEMEPDQVMAHLSGVLGRLTGMRADLQRRGTSKATQIRTKEVDPLIEMCDRQFKIHSRLQAVRQMDFDITRGAPS